MKLQNREVFILGAVMAVQILDVGLHIAINEVEILRVMSNALLLIATSLGVFLTRSSRAVLWGGAIGYVVLNLVFVALFGLENPATGVNRAPLFVFMAVSLWLTYRIGRLKAQAGLASPA